MSVLQISELDVVFLEGEIILEYLEIINTLRSTFKKGLKRNGINNEELRCFQKYFSFFINICGLLLHLKGEYMHTKYSKNLKWNFYPK